MRMIRIAIYSRKSKFTGKGESIGNQVELCRKYVQNLYGGDALEGVEVFEDEGFSGSNLKRPAFQDMLSQLRKRRFQAVIVYRVDRISRNISDFTGLIDELTKLDVSFVSIKEQFDTSTPMGRAMMYIISVFSQLERETIAERIRDNMHELAKTGRWLGGNTPTGYASESVANVTLDGKTRKACKLKVIPEEAQIIKTIYDLYLETDSLTAVEAELLRRRVRSKRGNDFTRFSIKGILQNPVYMIADENAYQYFAERDAAVYSPRKEFDGTRGIMAYNRTEQEKGRTTVFLPIEDWIIAVGKHPGLVPSAQWRAVQESLDRNRSKAYRKPRGNEALLTGLLYCACGERMYPKLTRRKTAEGAAVYTYVCKMKERSHRERCSRSNADGNGLDRAVVDQIRTLTGDEGLFSRLLEKSRRYYSGTREQYETQLAALKQEHAENERKVEGLIDSMALLDDSPAKGRILSHIEKLTEENQQIVLRIREVEGLTATDALNENEFSILRRMLTVFREIFDDMTVEEKRAAIRSVVCKVVWDGVNARVFLLGAEEDCETEEIPTDSTTRLGEDSK